MSISPELIKSLPKSDLHCHLDGSMRIATLIELAREQKIDLPSYEEAGLNELVFKKNYRDLSEYLLGFRYTSAVMQSFEAIERVAFEMAEDVYRDGVRYIEVRFAPQLLVSSGRDCVRTFISVNNGLARAAKKFNCIEAVESGRDIPFEYGIVCCGMRNFRAGMSGYYDNLLDILSGSARKDVIVTASVQAVRSALKARDEFGVPVVAFDLAGEEAGYPAGHHYAAYHEAHRNFMNKTVHAGEAYGPESIYEAITLCNAERIGHGTFIFASNRIKDPEIVDKVAYVDAIANYVATRRITVEVCPTSNLQTLPELNNDMSLHPVKTMIEYGMAVAVCTDNMIVSHTSVSRELALVAEACDLDRDAFKRLVLAAFKGAFYYGSYSEKRKFVKRAGDKIDEIFNR
ncbi:MAG: adenosine deaminase family protein [Kiritimatiellia bacterium]